MAAATNKRNRPWSPGAVRLLHQASRSKRTVAAVAARLKRTPGAVRQKARSEGLSMGVKQRGITIKNHKRRTQRTSTRPMWDAGYS